MNVNIREKELIENSRKKFEKMFNCPVSYHEEDIWGGRKKGTFTMKMKTTGDVKTWEQKSFTISDQESKIIFDDRNENTFFGFREEIPLGKTKGEVKLICYHWKVGENSQAENSIDFCKEDKKPEKEISKKQDPQEFEDIGKDRICQESLYQARSEKDKKGLIEQGKKEKRRRKISKGNF